jgi:hypothetical protein
MSFDISKVILGILFFVLGCNANSAKNYSTNAEQNECPTVERNFGDVLICLPKINGYLECLEDSLVRERANEEMELLGDEIIGVYLNNGLYAKFKNSPESTFWDEHIKIYGHPPMRNKDIPSNFLDKIESKLRKDSEIVPWAVAIDKINKGKIGFNIGKPALIEIYQPSDKVISIVYLADYDFLGRPGKILWIANMCILKNRLIYFGYYMEFDNANVKNILKQKSDEFGKELVRLNN